jgi:hypothetical protein
LSKEKNTANVYAKAAKEVAGEDSENEVAEEDIL